MENKEVAIHHDDDKYYITADSTYADERVHVLNHCDTFGIMDRWGEILPFGKEVQGLYHKDTRYISKIQLKINNYRPTLLSSNIKEENEILTVDLTNPEMLLDDGNILHHGMLHISRSQFVRENQFYEKIELQNFNDHSIKIDLTIEFDGDFKDIFEIRGLKREKRGDFLGFESINNSNINIGYRGLDDVVRKSEIHFSQPFDDKDIDKGLVKFSLSIIPKQPLFLDYSIFFKEGNQQDQLINYSVAKERLIPEIQETKSYFPVIDTSNDHFTHWINRSQADLVALIANTPLGKYPYAGVPWYNTAFGRDGIITALEVLWAAPSLAKDVLLFLAANQAVKLDEAADAEPGKILHETRGGEMVATNEIPFKQYYGTIDATPLFIILAGKYYERTCDLALIKKIWPNIQAAIQWIDEYGDLDKDGFVEYKHKAENGLTNQGWKDSHDSVFYASGEMAEPPIALCEVQGYVYAAKVLAAKIAKSLGKNELCQQWKEEAKLIKEKFNEVFWDDEMECYILALDGKKNPCRVKSSNAGHLLFTGIVDKDKAGKLVNSLIKDDMFNGWGIRTLSSNEIRYNPMSYHNGSVWPHDVALIAWGMAEYGFREEAAKLTTGLFDASLFINLHRLPELFCGFERRKGEGPTDYPVACSPQAWSVAAVFMLLKAILQIDISPEKKEISFKRSILPQYLNKINIKDLQVGDKTVDLEIIRHGNDDIGVTWRNSPEDWKLVITK